MKSLISRLVMGGAIILVGVALLLESLNIANTGQLITDWWPVLVILVGLLLLINDVKNYIWASLAIFVGGFLLARNLELIDVNFWTIAWPVVLIGIGLSVVFGSTGRRATGSKDGKDKITAILAGSESVNTSKDYKSGGITAILGGVQLDLRKANIKKTATVETFILLGGAEIIVPRNIVVRNQITATLGGVEDNTKQDEASEGTPELVLVGEVIGGGVEIKN